MKAENKALIGRECFIEVDGIRQQGEIVDVVESLKNPYNIILYCVRLNKRLSPQHHYDRGVSEVELI